MSNLSLALNFNVTWNGLTPLQLGGNITDVTGEYISNLTSSTDYSTFFDPAQWGSVSVSNLNYTLVEDPFAVKNKVLKVNYPAGVYDNPDNSTRRDDMVGGAQFFSRPSSNGAKRALLEYDVYFPPGFTFNYGGKLPGLYFF